MTALAQQPDITISITDHNRLRNVADCAMETAPGVAEFLLHELDRATVPTPNQASSTVKMGSRVRFRNETTERVYDVQVVYPAHADPSSGRISILTPIGVALIGLSVGQSMQWHDRCGKLKTLTVLAVQDDLRGLAYMDT